MCGVVYSVGGGGHLFLAGLVASDAFVGDGVSAEAAACVRLVVELSMVSGGHGLIALPSVLAIDAAAVCRFLAVGYFADNGCLRDRIHLDVGRRYGQCDLLDHLFQPIGRLRRAVDCGGLSRL